MKYYNKMTRQAGMTLIELTVVLLILVGLAGLLVPYVGSFVQKTHDSTSSSNLAQLNSAFIRFVTENNRVPHHMDTLVNADVTAGTGACSGAQVQFDPYCGLLDTSVFNTVTYATSDTGYESIQKAKIWMSVDNDTTAANKTFGSYTGMNNYMPGMGMGGLTDFHGIAVAALDATRAAALGVDATIEAHVALALGKDPMDYSSTCYDYVAFGLGDANGLVSKTIAQSPVNYPEDATMGPAEYYNHYIAIVRVDKLNTGTCSSVTEPAKFLGTVVNVSNMDGKGYLKGVNGNLATAYENQLADQSY